MWDHLKEIGVLVGIVGGVATIAYQVFIRPTARFSKLESEVDKCKKTLDTFLRKETFDIFLNSLYDEDKQTNKRRFAVHDEAIKCIKAAGYMTTPDHDKETEKCQRMNNMMFQKLAESQVKLENVIAQEHKQSHEHLDRLEAVTRELVVAVKILETKQTET